MTVLNLTKIIIFSRRWGFSLPLLKLKGFYNIINQFVKKSGILFFRYFPTFLSYISVELL